MDFYDFHMHSAFSGGESSLEQLAQTAKQLGYRGICLVFYYNDRKQKDILIAEIEKLKEKVGIEILLGFEARTVKEIYTLANIRRDFDLLLARGGDLRVNRTAVETPEVDILTHPESERNDSGLNQVLAKLAAKNDVAIEINFHEILSSNKKTRAKILSNIQNNVKLAEKFHVPIITCSGAVSHFELRDPLVLVSIAEELGLELSRAKETVAKVPEKILGKINERKDRKWVMPGVKVVRR